MYNFLTCWNKYERISFLQRVILIHSYLYYMLDETIWSDKKYDEISKQLAEMQENVTQVELVNNTDYGYVFFDYDGTTGFDLYYRLNKKDKKRISEIAQFLIGGQNESNS